MRTFVKAKIQSALEKTRNSEAAALTVNDPRWRKALYDAWDRDMTQEQIFKFLRESNAIEGIASLPSQWDIDIATEFLKLETVELKHLKGLQAYIAPNEPFRDKEGLDVGITGAPKQPVPGGPHIIEIVENCLLVAHIKDSDPWVIHCYFLNIHPFMDGNGRTSRLLWAWMMLRIGRDPFARSFLQEFYYQTLGSVSVMVFDKDTLMPPEKSKR